MTDETEETIETTLTVEVPAEPKPVDINDVDASWDGTGSLDDHRQAAFEKLKQPGFGRKGVKTDGE
jgi:hypothetical protein